MLHSVPSNLLVSLKRHSIYISCYYVLNIIYPYEASIILITYGISVWDEFKAHISPFWLHFFHSFLKRIFLGCCTTNLLQSTIRIHNVMLFKWYLVARLYKEFLCPAVEVPANINVWISLLTYKSVRMELLQKTANRFGEPTILMKKYGKPRDVINVENGLISALGFYKHTFVWSW